MSDEERLGRLKAVYDQVCVSYRAIDDFRTKLLGFLPLATGTGLTLLVGNVSDPTKADTVKLLSGPVGAFGVIITLGLLAYELHGIKKCGYLIRTGQDIEHALGVKGAFRSRPHELAGFIDEPFSASVVYPASLAAWTFFALAFHGEDSAKQTWFISASISAGAIFIAVSIASLWIIRRMEDDLITCVEYGREPNLLRLTRRRQKAEPKLINP